MGLFNRTNVVNLCANHEEDFQSILCYIAITFLVFLTAFLLFILVIFGSWRRRCSSRAFRFIMFIAYISPTYMLAYTLGLMRKSLGGIGFFALWPMYLMVVLASADSFSAYSLEDNEQWKRYNWQLCIKLAVLAWLLSSVWVLDDPIFLTVVLGIMVVLILKFHERALALAGASRRSLERRTKVIADFMLDKHREHHGAVDAGDDFDMKNCYYLVRGEEHKLDNILGICHFKWWKDKITPPERKPDYWAPVDITRKNVITLGKVWSCQGRLLSSEGDPDDKLKDYCLSFALFKLLCLRYGGHTLPHEVHQKTWTLLQKELLSRPDDGHQRAFRVLEIELSYLFDFFYTKYWAIFYPGRTFLKLVEIVYVVIGIGVSTLLLIPPSYALAQVSAATTLLFTAAELVQLFFICFSEWTILVCICKYVQRESLQNKKWIERMVKFMHRVQIVRPWERKLHQYSFLEFYSYRPCGLIYNWISASFIDERRNGQGQSKPIKLSEDVTKAVFDTLKSNSGANLENGRVSLQENNVSEQLSWACKLEKQTQVILVWHIATSFCEQRLEWHKFSWNSSRVGTATNFGIAANLSKYLAYLVVFAPQLLPDHRSTAEDVFDGAILEARIFFKSCEAKSKKGKMESQIEEMNKQGRPSSPEEQRKETIILQGAWLGKQLVDDVKDEARIWKILAEFWAEMMIYVAPSDDAKAHAEQLTVGGEFVTHLWALVSHAGLKRCVPSGAD